MPSAPIRAFHLIHDLGPGGAEHVLVDLASVAADAGIELTVVSMLPTDGLRYPELFEAAGVTVESLELRAWWDPRGPRRLRRLVERAAPDVLHSHLKHADTIAGRVAERAGIPHVSTLHVIEDSVTGLARWKRDLAARSRMRTAATTVAVSEAIREWYLDTFPESPDRVVVIRNGVPDPGEPEPGTRQAVRDELGISQDAVVAAMVAVMRPGKGHDVLLAAAGELDGVVFLLAGDGPERASLEARASALPVGRVVFAGFREDVDRVLAASDLVVHPTLADALPTALIHAAAAGLPVVASRVGGVPEIVSPDGGVLVDAGDSRVLADAVRAVAADPDGRRLMGKRNRERYDGEFTATVWAERLGALYDTLG